MQHDAWFFVGVFAFIFLIWIATGGPARPLSWSGPTLAQPEELGGGTYLGLPRAPFTIGNADVTLPSSSNTRSYKPFSVFGSTVGGLPFGTPSPYRESIRLNGYVSSASSTSARKEYLRFDVATSAPAPVAITGWRLTSEITDNTARIPDGSPVPRLGTVNARQPIVLSPGERAIVHTGRSPIGVSFRENVCSGYLDEFQAFTPSLPKACPTALEEFERIYGPYYVRDTSCIEYLKTINRCETVTYVSRRKIAAVCRDFALKNLNYNSCVASHRDEATFPGKTWHIYLNQEDSLWRARGEIIKLFDVDMKTVGAFAY